MNEDMMEAMIVYFQRYKWWILSGFTVVACGLISLLAYILVFEIPPDNLEVRVEIPSASPSLQTMIIDTPTLVQEPIQSPIPPAEVKIQVTESRQLAFVQRVIDGDSIEVILDGELYELRYIGIDAPETGMPLFEEATELNKRLVENQIVELEADVSDTDQYGRLLRYVYLPDGSLVNAEMVGLGLAAANAYPPDLKCQQEIDSREQSAKDTEIGLWAPSATPTPIIEISGEINIQVDPSCSQFNAPGNDNDNKNEEYVCIVNNGRMLVEMHGWSIHDEYGWAYHFPVFTLEVDSYVKVFTGCGSDSLQALYWCKDETAVWNNDGDCVYLINSDGIETASYCY